MTTCTVLAVETPQGPGRCYVDLAEEPTALLVLGHGAGGGTHAADLELLARRLPSLGVTVVRFEQPWRTAGRRVAGPPATLDEAWRAAVAELRLQPWAAGRLFVGGRSAGARVACRTALAVEAVGVVCLAFPLHLPGRPEKSRAAELLTAGVPRLVLQGSKDTFGTPDEIREAMGMAPGIRLVELPGADHGFRVTKAASFTAADLRARVLAEVGLFVCG
ncbi:MAG TPA: alpha/beta family hydrolase [Propionibacteriaceae bacterium]|nr:alpha/beta family hydrolase [Propionibacteriaceae bacterium]